MSEKNPYEQKNFTISVEEIPDVDLKILNITKGKKVFTTTLTQGESDEIINTFGFVVSPPIFEVL